MTAYGRPGLGRDEDVVEQTSDVSMQVSSARERSVADLGRTALWVALPPTLWILFGSRLSSFGTDSAHAYWNVWRIGPYSLPPGSVDAFNYTPAFAQVIYPLTLLPWPVFLTVWSLLTASALVWLLWPLERRWRWLVLAYVVPPALLIGNIEAFLALAAVIGMRHPSAWAFPLLTKLTPGLGPVWFAMRRDWRQTAMAAVGTAAVLAVSFAVSPQLWLQWWDFILSSPTPPTQSGYPPLSLRLVIALGVLAWGAVRDRRGAVAVAMTLAMPLWSSGVLVLLTAVPRLRSAGHGSSEE